MEGSQNSENLEQRDMALDLDEGHHVCEERGDTIRAMGDENELSDCCKGAMLETKKLQWIRF